MRIEVNKTNLRKYGEEINQNNEEFKTCISQFTSIIDSINNAWEGDDSLKYINTMKDKYLENLKELNKTINDYGNYLKTASSSYDMIDSVFSSKKIN